MATLRKEFANTRSPGSQPFVTGLTGPESEGEGQWKKRRLPVAQGVKEPN